MLRVPNILDQNRREVYYRLDGQNQLFHVETMLDRGVVQGCVDLIEEGRTSQEASKPADGACWVLAGLMGRTYEGLEGIMEKRGS